MVNGELVSGFYEIKDGDEIEFKDYYTLKQVLEFMDIIYCEKVYVNNALADMDTKVYDNFSILCEIKKEEPNYTELFETYGEPEFPEETIYSIEELEKHSNENQSEEYSAESKSEEEQKKEISVENAVDSHDDLAYESGLAGNSEKENVTKDDNNKPETHSTGGETAGEQSKNEEENAEIHDITITVNGDTVVMKGKKKYILVDVLDFYPVDTSVAHGDHLETSVNGVRGDFMLPVNHGDSVVIKWV